MTTSIDERWLTALSDWARGEPSVLKAWVFGSRAKGSARQESDLDVAVFLESEDRTVQVEWILNARTWASEAQSQVGAFPKIDLQLADPECDEVVWPAVQEHGIPFYEKNYT